MSDYHILQLNAKQDRLTVAFHIPIPNESNSAGVNKRTAVIQYMPDRVSSVPWISAAEQTQLTNGEIFELVEDVEVNANLTLGEKRSLVDARFTALTGAAGLGKLDKVLDYWGLDRDVP